MSCSASVPAAAARGERMIQAAVSSARSPERENFIEFEFRLDDSAPMLAADELFADGKLLPLLAPQQKSDDPPPPPPPVLPRRVLDIAPPDPYVFSPKAPSCSSRWRELLGFKKSPSPSPSRPGSSPSPSSSSMSTTGESKKPQASRSLKLLLQRHAVRSNFENCESTISSARMSLSSSSSSSSSSDHDTIVLPRFSVDTDARNPPRIRLVRSIPDLPCRKSVSPGRRHTVPPPAIAASVDSPRMNASGKIIYQGLGRSSSSPATTGAGGKKWATRIDRTYSGGGVKVAPVLNVPPVAFGFGYMFAPQTSRKEKRAAASR